MRRIAALIAAEATGISAAHEKLRTRLEAIKADGALRPQQKLAVAKAVKDEADGELGLIQRRIGKMKADALRECLAEEANIRSFTLGKLTIEVEPTQAPRGVDDTPLCYKLRILGDKRRLIHEDTHVVFNPPISVYEGEDENGNPIIVEDHKRALRQLVEGQVRRALGAAR